VTRHARREKLAGQMDVDSFRPAPAPDSPNTFRSAQRWGSANLRVLTTCAAFAGTFAFSMGSEQPRMTLFSNTLLSGLAAAMAWLSFNHHRVALGAVAVLCFGSPAFSPSFAASELVVVFVLYQIVSRSSIPARVVALVGFVSLTVNDLWLRRITKLPLTEPTVLYPVILTALAVGLGLQARRLRLQHAELVDLQHVDRERAILSERQRIARDLHDVAAHHLSALIVQNKLARRVATTEALEGAADFSATTAKEALDAVRQVVGVLSSEAMVDPQPTIEDLEPMFERLHAAGLNVHRSIDPTLLASSSSIRRDVELAIVRISQEAFTNILRHRGPGNAWLTLSISSGQARLRIEDDGPSKDPEVPAGKPDSGYGLINMAERATSSGGTFRVDKSRRGGWRVEATLPLGSEL
jgi:signal transduction histidine kinase